ncbi:MAG: hypothetical protein J2P45_20010, partial [Candidatus Dormibacteraeota bacterium]|nr:hypothetical protein [Candidatus Dormibacteraeota bacterium]
MRAATGQALQGGLDQVAGAGGVPEAPFEQARPRDRKQHVPWLMLVSGGQQPLRGPVAPAAREPPGEQEAGQRRGLAV